MEKLYNSFKISSIITFILIILSITWLILDYYVLKDVLADEALFSTWELLILKISLAVFVILIFSMMITLFFSFRMGLKSKTLNKKIEHAIPNEDLPALDESEKV